MTTKIHSFKKLLLASAAVISLGACADDTVYNRMSGETMASNKQTNMTSQASFLALADRVAQDGNHQGAIPLYRKAHERNSFDHRPLLGLGKSLMAVGDYAEAIDVLISAYERDETNAHTLTALGQVYLYLGEATLARNNFEAAIITEAALPAAYSGLGLALDLDNRHREAISTFNAGLAKFPDDRTLISNMALSMALNGEGDEAVALLTNLAGTGNADSRDRQNLALALALNGEEEKAWRVASIDTDSEAATRLIQDYTILGALPTQQRFQSLIVADSSPRGDLEAPANMSANDNPEADEAMERIASEKQPEPVMEVQPEPEQPEIPPLIEPEGWAVQIAAYKRLEDVMPGWRQLSTKYADIIGHLAPRRSEVDFGAERYEPGPKGFYYRLNAGPLESYEEAKAICDALSEAGGECWIRPPEPTEGNLPERGEG